MLTAQQAQKAADQAVRRQHRARIKADKERKKLTRARVAKCKKEEVPFTMQQIEKEIAEATKSGKKSVVTKVNHYHSDWPSYLDWHEVNAAHIDGVTKRLEKKGFKVESRYREYESNYGDFNAPCNVTERFYELKISWGKPDSSW